jgi:archaellum component FlaC
MDKDTVEMNFGRIKHILGIFLEMMESLRTVVGLHEDRLETHKSRVEGLEKRLEALETSVETLEGAPNRIQGSSDQD